MDDERFSFQIDAYAPETFPMERLGAYIADLGAMLGEKDLVNLVEIAPGSTRIVHRVRAEAVGRVNATLAALALGQADPARQRAHASLTQRLKEDKTSARYARVGDEAVVLDFPGTKETEPVVFGPMEQRTSIDGTVIALGGRDKTVPVRILDGESVIPCTATRETAKSLAPFLFDDLLRFNGVGRWTRHEVHGWKLEHLKIESFHPLGRKSLIEEVRDLRAIAAEWDLDDLSER